MYRVSVVGQGYVGLPLAIEASAAGYIVDGVDINSERVQKLNAGQSVIEDLSDDLIGNALNSGKYRAIDNFAQINQSDVVLICVPTPLNSEHKPDLNPLISAVKSVAENIKKSTLIIIESTVEPGTTRNVILPLILQGSGLTKEQFFLAFSPERIDPANRKWTIKNTPKLVSGLTQQAVTMTVNFYSKFINTIEVCYSLEVAETAKLLENSFRFINISFIQEVSIFCQKLGIDVYQVISAAATKPYGFMPFYPSIGVGGHCIPVDPLYLANKAREMGVTTRFINLADQINQEMPGYFVGRAEEKLGGLENKLILIIGVSYKPNVADIRETPVTALVKGLKNKGAQVFWHDDLINDWNGEKSVELREGFDLAVIATLHSYIDLTKLGDTPILDTRGSI